jgi:hypothetical protein
MVVAMAAALGHPSSWVKGLLIDAADATNDINKNSFNNH